MEKLCSDFEKANTCVAYPFGAMNFISLLGIRFRIANSCTRWCGIFKGLSQDGGQADFSKNLHASLLNKGLSSEPSRWTVSLNYYLAVSPLFFECPLQIFHTYMSCTYNKTCTQIEHRLLISFARTS
jgi:hypothetical protein